MALTDKWLLLERPHLGGVQRIYRFPTGWGLSVVNSTMLHSYPFAWEIAVLRSVRDDGGFRKIDYQTGLTEDVEVFQTDDEANAFIERAAIQIGTVRTSANAKEA